MHVLDWYINEKLALSETHYKLWLIIVELEYMMYKYVFLYGTLQIILPLNYLQSNLYMTTIHSCI